MKRRPGTRKCEYVNDEGVQCRAYALRDVDPPRCSIHSMSPEQRKARSHRAASVSALRRRANVEPKVRSGLDCDLFLEDVVAVIRPALEATFDHDGSPDYSARLAAAGTLLAAFPRQYKETPEKVRELLERVLPEPVSDAERMKSERVYRAMRREWDELPSWHPIRGLYVKRYPSYMVAPWENAEQIQKQRPADVPADRASVRQLEGGRAILERPGGLPLLLEPEVEDDGGMIRAPSILR